MRLTRRQVTSGLAAGVTLACGSRVLAADGDRIVVAPSSDVITLDPSQDTSSVGVTVLFKNVYDQLTDIGADGSVVPQLASSWETSADAKTWTFRLRRDAVFHDGEPVTADDVVWSYTKIMADGRSPVRVYLTKVKSVEKAGDDAVRFELTEPFAPFDRQVSLISVLPRKAYEAAGARAFATSPIGSGPYRVVRWVKDDALELAANPRYWGGAPRVPSLVFRPVPADAARAAAMLSGQVDVVPLLPPALIQRLESRPGVTLTRVESNRVLYLGLNTGHPILSDLRVRRAIDMAVNRDAITDRLLHGMGRPAGQVVAPVTFGHDPAVKPTAFAPDEARRLLKEAGYSGEPLPLTYPRNRYAFGEEVVQAVAGGLKEVGIATELQGLEYTAMFPLWANRKLSAIHLWAFGPSIMDADLVINYLYAPNAAGYWIDPEVQTLIAAQRAEADKTKRRALIGQIWRRSQENVPYVPLYVEVQAYGVNPKLAWSPRPDERLTFATASWT